mmetsp:Transcript_43973/g.116235  ORF Transcript_43973/g.116235 Transcript_43973/m.116235 type:complete len:798 (+) Transcript_43973:74-2467(+)
MSSSLPELPPLGALPRSASQPQVLGVFGGPPPPGAPLPRHVAPPQAGGDPSAEVIQCARALHQSESLGRLDGARGASCGGGAGGSLSGHLLLVPHHELPPLRGASMLQSRGSSRLHSSSMSRRADVDFFYDTALSGEASPMAKSAVQLGSRASTRGVAGRSALSQLDITWRDPQEDTKLASLHEVESLKRQVSRLTQLRRDRDSYIQDLLDEVEAARQLQEGDLEQSRRAAVCSQKVSEQLVAQKRDHERELEELRHAHAVALEEQVRRYESEAAELRAALCSEVERRLSERIFVNQRFKLRALAGISAELQHWKQLMLHTWREVAVQVKCEASHQEEMSNAALKFQGERAAFEKKAAEAEDRHQRELEATTHRLSSEAAELRARLEGQVAALCARQRNLALAKLISEASWAAQATIRAWARVAQDAAGQRQRQEAVAQQAARLRAQTYLTLQASLCHAKHAALRAWASLASEAKSVRAVAEEVARRVSGEAETQRETERRKAEEGGREEVVARIGRLSSLLEERSRRIARLMAQQQLVASILAWAAAARDHRREASHRHKLLTMAADSTSELYRLRVESKKAATELRCQRRAHGVAAIHASLDRRLQAVVHCWSMVARDAQRESIYQRQLDIAAAESAAGCAVLRMEGRRTMLELKHQRRTQALRTVRMGLRHWRHVVLYAWSMLVAHEKRAILHEYEVACFGAQVEARCLREGRLREMAWVASVLSAWAAQVACAANGQRQQASRLCGVRWAVAMMQVVEEPSLASLRSTAWVFACWCLAAAKAAACNPSQPSWR